MGRTKSTERSRNQVQRSPQRSSLRTLQQAGSSSAVTSQGATGSVSRSDVRLTRSQTRAIRQMVDDSQQRGQGSQQGISAPRQQQQQQQGPSSSSSTILVQPGVSSEVPPGTQSTDPNFHYQPTLVNVAYHSTVVVTDLLQDDQIEMQERMEAEKNLPDKLVYWRAVLRFDDELRKTICNTIQPSDLILHAPNIVTPPEEDKIKARSQMDGAKKACQFLLECLMRSVDIGWPEQFLYGLEQLNLRHIAHLLRNKLQGVQKKKADFYRNKVLTYPIGHPSLPMLRPSANPDFQATGSQVHGEHLRFSIIGMTGFGKSALGNSILLANPTSEVENELLAESEENSSYFTKMTTKFKKRAPNEKLFVSENRPGSVTINCKRIDGHVLGRDISIVDTPGFFDTERALDETVKELVNCIHSIAPGPHAILVVVKAGRMTKEVVEGIRTMRRVIGDGSLDYIIVVFTYIDSFSATYTLERYVDDISGDCRKLLEDCGMRYVGFNNNLYPTSKENVKQVMQLLGFADKISKDNKGKCYTSEHFELAAAVIKEEEERRRAEFEKMKKEENDLKKKHEQEAKKRNAQHEKEKKEYLEQLQQIREREQFQQQNAQQKQELASILEKLEKGNEEKNETIRKLEMESRKRAEQDLKKVNDLKRKLQEQIQKAAMVSETGRKSQAEIKKILKEERKKYEEERKKNEEERKKNSCFAADSSVEVRDRNGQVTTKRLDSLVIGDQVRSYDPDIKRIVFSEVYFITYQNDLATTESILRRLWYKDTDLNERSVRLHSNHLVYATKVFNHDDSPKEPPPLPIMSKNVEVGDLLWVQDSNDNLVPVPVMKIEEVLTNVRHPLTLNHTVIVDGVLASVHVFNENLLRKVTFPLRFLYKISPSLNESWVTKKIVQTWDWVEDNFLA